MKLTCIACAAAGFVALTSAAHALDWNELGSGSGTPPGLFNISLYDSSVAPGTEVPEQPQLAINPSRSTMIILNSRRIVGEVARSQTRSLAFVGNAWTLMPGQRAMVFPDLDTAVGADPLVAYSPDLLAAVMNGQEPLGFTSDAFVSFYSSTAWTERGGSLDAGGITDVTQFANQVYDVAIALDPLDRAGVAYSQGSLSRRGIYYRKFDGTNWVEVNGSATTPIAASTSASITNIQPTTYFFGSSPVVAFTYVDNTINETVKLLRHDSGDGLWKGLGTSDTTGLGLGRHPKLAGLRNGSSFYLAFENRFTGALTVMAWTGTQWQDRGNPLTPWGLTEIVPFDEVLHGEPAVPNFDIKVDATGRPIVAFRAEYPPASGQYQIFASYRNSSGTWVALGDSSTGAGTSNFAYTPAVSGNAYGHYHPSITLGPDSKPVIAWSFENGAPSTRCVLVRKYDTAVNSIIANKANIIALLLGNIASDPDLLNVLDFNNDNVVDAGDVERLPN